MVTGGVFISYRGEDSGSYGALLYVELSRWFGPDLVFVDSCGVRNESLRRSVSAVTLDRP
jgi:hypothetical protein